MQYWTPNSYNCPNSVIIKVRLKISVFAPWSESLLLLVTHPTPRKCHQNSSTNFAVTVWTDNHKHRQRENDGCARACPGFFIGGKTEEPKIEAEGRERGWAASPSLPASGSMGALWAPSAGFGAEPRPPKGFPLFSALRMASPDTQ